MLYSSTSISKGETITLTATGGSSYKWSSGETSHSITIRPESSSTYQVTVSSGNCSSTASISIEVKNDYLALNGTNIMSPNGDGINDNFIIKNIDMYPNNTVKIYDRAGRLLYSKANYKDEWNGTFDGSPLDEGTYFYIVDFGNAAGPIRGYITIVRD